MTDQNTYVFVDRFANLPAGLDEQQLVDFFHHTMKPYQDSPEDVRRALHDALDEDGLGGFLMVAMLGTKLQGGLLMLKTGMKGYIPEHILLFVSIDPSLRGQGLGGKLIKKSMEHCDGQVKLHVDHDNPARRLYERLGFVHKYAEMRYTP